MSASRSRTGSTTCCRACARRSRSRSSATTSTRCGRTAERLRQRLATIPGLVDLQVEKQVRIPQLEIRVDYRRAGALRRAAGRGDRSDQPAVERPRGLARRRRLPPLRRGDAAARPAAHDAEARRPPDRDAGRLDSRRARSRRSARPTAPTRSCARTAAGASSCSPTPTAAADMAQVVAAIRRELAATRLPEGFFTRLEGTFQAQEEASRTIGAALARLAGADLRHPLQPLPLGGAGADHHGQRAAGADRLGRGALDRRPAALGRLA